MPTKVIDIYELKHVSYLSAIKCEDFSEAAAVCLDFHQHPQEIIIKASFNNVNREFKLIWKKVTPKIRASRNDMGYSVESGAYCLAMMVLKELTDFTTVKQSKKGTGFDYWLSKAPSSNGLQEQARMEVSGILKGTVGQINQRLKEKIKQTQKSDSMKIPAFIVIVEFSTPLLKIVKK